MGKWKSTERSTDVVSSEISLQFYIHVQERQPEKEGGKKKKREKKNEKKKVTNIIRRMES